MRHYSNAGLYKQHGMVSGIAQQNTGTRTTETNGHNACVCLSFLVCVLLHHTRYRCMMTNQQVHIAILIYKQRCRLWGGMNHFYCRKCLGRCFNSEVWKCRMEPVEWLVIEATKMHTTVISNEL